ncbi:uncharacterized protein RJT20DRAFT_132169 [Scheffersomyces xylosifermentans]|uniref:uncharacterized protein n=1 Tax=Scheffersomyces xylosifermentans TaxID=1304137 RepID=UPI00315DE0B3
MATPEKDKKGHTPDRNDRAIPSSTASGATSSRNVTPRTVQAQRTPTKPVSRAPLGSSSVPPPIETSPIRTSVNPKINQEHQIAQSVSRKSDEVPFEAKRAVDPFNQRRSVSPYDSGSAPISPISNHEGVDRSSTRLRRKPPPPTFDSNNSSNDNLYFNDKRLSLDQGTEDYSDSPRDSNKNIDDIIGSLENEIDNFLTFDNSSSSNRNENLFHYDTGNNSSTSVTQQLRITRSPQIMQLSDYNDSASSRGGSIYKNNIDSKSAPIETPYSLDTPTEQSESEFEDSREDEGMPEIMSDILTGDEEYDQAPHQMGSIVTGEEFENTDFSLSSSPNSTTPNEETNSLDNNTHSFQRKSVTSGIMPVSTNSSLGSSGSLKIAKQVSGTTAGVPVAAATVAAVSAAVGSPASPAALNRSPLTASSTMSRVPIKSNNAPMDSIFSGAESMAKSRTVSTMTSSMKHNRNSSSISSIRSYRNVNLATLKKGLNLKPGEGERSNYVLTIRRSAGTAYNESGPGKWKLPTGIKPIDKSVSLTNNNNKYMRLGSSQYSRAKKGGSGVELKHGHLQRRLLAAEIDDRDDQSMTLDQSITNTISKTTTTSSEVKSVNSNTAPQSSSATLSGENSLKRTVTEGTTDALSVTTESTNESKRTASVSSDSSGSLSEIGGYYQHRGYKYNEADDPDDEENATEVETSNGKNTFALPPEDGSDERPRLFLANPDYSSDSD